MGDRHRRAGIATAAGVLAAVLAMSGCVGGTVDPEARYGGVDTAIAGDSAAAFQQVLADAVALSGSSGGLATIHAPWAGEWEGVAGVVAFDEGAAPVEPDDDFHLAGVTTELTCLVLLRLADIGTVALDDEVEEYLDDLPGIEGITLEQLCRHTSGIADYQPTLQRHFVQNPERAWARMELVSAGLALPRVGAPGEAHSPSNTGILLLALALERAAHKPWPDLLRDQVTGPLGLDETVVPATDDVVHADALGAYATLPGPDGAPDCATRTDDSRQSSSMGGAASGALSSLDDAATLSLAFASGSLLSEHSFREQWTTDPLPNTETWVSQGVGGRQYGPLRGTASAGVGALTAAFTDPESGLTVVVALNNSSSGADFVRETAFALASLASKLPPADGETQPLIELPWSIDQAKEKMSQLARCSTPVQ
ncbi:serine hydrolase [Agromyces sp. CFH 90414]|uniref:Serine hydrolase n=1 Tax=Agromyces agglutinans TaxID=2662258 RepID=A0A6I2F9M1_9MICO|nr:serine hydrolase domain-containing protein [Agromyces agglutinans]MRG59046.1 serine hydrolase [Agromyces agglutinans]